MELSGVFAVSGISVSRELVPVMNIQAESEDLICKLHPESEMCRKMLMKEISMFIPLTLMSDQQKLLALISSGRS